MIPLRFLPYIALAAGLVVGGFLLHQRGYDKGLDRGRQELADYVVRATEAAEDARRAAVEAVEARGVAALGQAEIARQRASNEASSWRKRYNDAIKESPECESWSLQPVRCPLPVPNRP